MTMRLAAAALLLLLASTPALAATETFLAPQGQVSSLMIFEQTGFARVYGIFKEGIARFMYDDQLKVLDDLKLALLIRSFSSASAVLNGDFAVEGTYDLDKEKEVAFVQTEPARFEGGKGKIKGQLLIGAIRKDVVAEAELNKVGRISKTADVMEEGKPTIGLSMHFNFKRSDYGLSSSNNPTPFNDDVVLMLDLVGQR